MMNGYVPSHVIILASDVAVTFSFWALIAVPFVTTLVWPWWKSFWGLNLVLLDVAIAFALLPSALTVDFGVRFSSAIVAWTEITSIALAGVIALWRGVMVIIGQLKGSGVAPVQLWLAALKSLRRQ